MIERIYRTVSSQTNVKGVFVKNKNKNKEYFLDLVLEMLLSHEDVFKRRDWRTGKIVELIKSKD